MDLRSLLPLIVTPDFGRSDAWHFSFATKYLLGQSLQKGELPLWNSNLGAGFPLIGEGQIGAFYLPNLILFRLFEPTIAYNLALTLALLMLGWGMYVWLRLMRYARIPALVAAVTLPLSGMAIAQLPHMSLIQGFSMLPWIATATVLLSQKRTTVVLGFWAILVSQQLLAGFPQASFITVLFVSGYYLWLIKDHKQKLLSILWYGAAAILSLGLSAIQLFPSWEFLGQSNAAGGLDPEIASYFSYPLKHLVTLVLPFALGSPKDASYPSFTAFDGSIFWENVGGIGPFPIVLLAYLGITYRKKFSSTAMFFFGTGLMSFLLMLGKYSPLYLIYSFFPFNLFRVPSRFIWIFVPAILILATEVWTKLWHITPYKTVIRSMLIAGAVLNTIFLLSSWIPYHSFEPAGEWLEKPTSAHIIKPEEGRVLTIGAEAAHNRIFLTQGWKTPNTYQFLKNTLAPNSNALWDIPSAQVYAGRFLWRQTMFDELLATHLTTSDTHATLSATGKKLLDMLSVKTVLSALPLTQTALRKRNSWVNGDQTITAWQNATPLPRVYLATHPMLATTKEEAFAAIVRDTFIPGTSVIVEQPISLEESSKEPPARVTTQQQTKETELNVRVENATGTILVITDTYYPGWEATIDGSEAFIFPVNIRQMGILLPAGDHDIQLRFVPRNIINGAILSGISLVILIGLTAFPIFSALFRRRQVILLPGLRFPRSRGTSRPRKGKATDQA